MMWLGWIARLAAGLVLAVSGFLKLLPPPEEFAFALESYQILPFEWLVPFARVLPWVELAVGVFLVVGLFIRPAAVASALLYAAFIGALVQAKARGIELTDCGCFGRGGPHFTFVQAMIFDGILLALAALSAWRPSLLFSVDGLFEKKKHTSH